MNPLSRLRRRFKMHKAFSRNPRRSMATDVAKTTCLMGLVAIAAWMSFSIATQGVQTSPMAQELSSNTEVSSTGANVVATIANADGTQTPPANAELPASAQPTPETNNTIPFNQLANQDNIFESNWILLLPDEKFIVQIGSSPDRDQLYLDAKAFPNGPVSFYPFKLTPTRRPIYGFAAGVYDSLEEASLAIKQWPGSVIARDPWIRPVNILKKQIQAVAN